MTSPTNEMAGESIATGATSKPRFAMNCPRVRPKTAGMQKIATKGAAISPTVSW